MADTKPTRDELLEMLDNVSAALDTVLAHYGVSMPSADRQARRALCDEARAVCDRELRPITDQEEE